MNKFHALKKGIDFIILFNEFRFEVDVDEYVLTVIYANFITTHFVVYNKDTTLFKKFTNKNDLIYWFLKINCLNSIKLITSYNSNFIYNKKYKNSIVIQREYRKYRLRTARIRNDLVIRGLTELWFHPSKILFEC